MTPHLFEQTYPAELASATRARRAVVDVLPDDRLADDVQLVVSELAANAVLHAASGFRITVDADGSRLRISVCDRGGAAPVRQDLDPHATRGRGMIIVEAIAEDWGVETVEGGKRVWAQLALPGSPDVALGA